jgi:hypothetical protein
MALPLPSFREFISPHLFSCRFSLQFNSTVQLNAFERAAVQFQSWLNGIERVCFLFTNAVEFCEDDESNMSNVTPIPFSFKVGVTA